jgi:hypothetical protein
MPGASKILPLGEELWLGDARAGVDWRQLEVCAKNRKLVRLKYGTTVIQFANAIRR